MVDYLPRSAWGARPPKDGPGSLVASRVEGVAIHWPGTTSHTPILSLSAVASALRGWQDYHMDGRGWSDIAYQVAVDQAGRAWTLRGLRTQSGANGNTDVNERFGAILLVLVQGEEPSEAMKATTRAVVADFRAMYPAGIKVVGHKDIRPSSTGQPSTDCPGPAAYAALGRGDFNPNQPEDDMPYTEDQLRAIVQAEIEEYMTRFWVAPTGTGTALRAQVAAILANQDPAKLAEAIVAKLPAGLVDQATVEAGVRAVLLDAATAD